MSVIVNFNRIGMFALSGLKDKNNQYVTHLYPEYLFHYHSSVSTYFTAATREDGRTFRPTS